MRESLEAKLGRVEAALSVLVPLAERAVELGRTETRSREEERQVLDQALQAAHRIEAAAVKGEALVASVERLEAALTTVAAEQFDHLARFGKALDDAKVKLRAIDGASATAFTVAETLRGLATVAAEAAKERTVAAAWAAHMSGLAQELFVVLQGAGRKDITDRKALEFLAFGEATMARVAATLPTEASA